MGIQFFVEMAFCSCDQPGAEDTCAEQMAQLRAKILMYMLLWSSTVMSGGTDTMHCGNV